MAQRSIPYSIQIERNAIPNVKLIILGNKTDMEEKREVDAEEMRQFCQQKGISFLEVSAKSGDNVLQAFETISAELMKIYPKE